ncbi:phage tail tape measure protein [Vibrio variabilis]|uniref:Phage tail tape measure protein n=1 Tax=Vibrio variabilis TaxID=990271 RepID=A0ABQ0JR50_9VIBR|nr:phage tail tape measure protein [Vibrio variabilis]
MANLTASLILKLTDQASAPLKQATKQTKALNQRFESTRRTLTSLNATSSEVGRFRELKKGAQDTKAAIRHQQAEVHRLSQALRQADKPTKGLTRSLGKAKKELAALNKRASAQQKALKHTSIGLKQAGVNTKRLSQEQARLQRESKAASIALKTQRYELARQQSAAIIAAKRQKDYTSALSQTKSRLSTLGKWGTRSAGAVTLAMGGAFKMTTSLAEKLDAAQRHADKLGLGVKAVQELDYAAQRSGLSIEQTRMAMQRSTRRIAEAAQGTGEAVNASMNWD